MNYNRFSHIYLYAKNWYKKSENTMDDLLKIFNHIYGHSCSSKKDVIEVLTHITFKHIQSASNPNYQFSRFINTLNPESFENKLYNKERNFEERLLDVCLSIIGLTNKDEINGELEEPDENILPLTKS